MSARRRGASVKPVGAGTGSGWDDYSIGGSGASVEVTANPDAAIAPGHLQVWYKSDTVAPRVLGTFDAPLVTELIVTPDARSGPNAFAWVVQTNGVGDVIQVGAEVDVTD